MIPSLDAVQALNGRIFATLSKDDEAVLNFYRGRGRKFDVSIVIRNAVDPEKLAQASSREQADQLLKAANSQVIVYVGPNAKAFWADRVAG